MTEYSRKSAALWFYGQVTPLKKKISIEADLDNPEEVKRFETAVTDQYFTQVRAKRNRPEILEAIIAVRGHNKPSEHPYKVAAGILPRVNAWLKKRGYEPVLRKALAGRIARI